jgi:hypothetical protein
MSIFFGAPSDSADVGVLSECSASDESSTSFFELSSGMARVGMPGCQVSGYCLGIGSGG